MKKVFKAGMVGILSLTMLSGAIVVSADTSTSTTATSTLVSQIQALLQQVKALQDQLSALQTQKSQITSEIQSTLQLARQLSLGMTGDDVKLLQQILATDPDIYPEGLTTGYFGSLTEKAVKKFQAKFGIDQAGRVGPQTLTRLNQLLTEGAGSSGKVPPGLLIAPGIAKKLGYNPTVPSGQTLPPGIAKKLGKDSTASTTPDTVVPVISNLKASTTASTTAVVSWTTNEYAKSTIWYATSTPVATSTAYKLESDSLKLSHSFGLSGLTATTTYYYTVSSTDAAGNSATSTGNSFTTPE